VLRGAAKERRANEIARNAIGQSQSPGAIQPSIKLSMQCATDAKDATDASKKNKNWKLCVQSRGGEEEEENRQAPGK
jgi:hypothetical protein